MEVPIIKSLRMLPRSSEESSKSPLWAQAMVKSPWKLYQTTERTSSSTMESSKSKKLSSLFCRTWMKSSAPGLKSPELSRPTRSSNRRKPKEPRRSGRINRIWEKSLTLSFWVLRTGTPSSMEEKLGSSIFMKPTAQPVSNWIKIGNWLLPVWREKSRLPSWTSLRQETKLYKIKSNFPSTRQWDSTRVDQKKFRNSPSLKECTRDFQFRSGWIPNCKKRPQQLMWHRWPRRVTIPCASRPKTLASWFSLMGRTVRWCQRSKSCQSSTWRSQSHL